MTCYELGGACDAQISGETPEEMVKNGIEHMEKNHPEIAQRLKEKGSGGGSKFQEWTDKIMDEWGPAEE